MEWVFWDAFNRHKLYTPELFWEYRPPIIQLAASMIPLASADLDASPPTATALPPAAVMAATTFPRRPCWKRNSRLKRHPANDLAMPAQCHGRARGDLRLTMACSYIYPSEENLCQFDAITAAKGNRLMRWLGRPRIHWFRIYELLNNSAARLR